MKIINLGCGTKTSNDPRVVNIDWSLYLRLRRNRVLRELALRVLRGEQLERFRKLPDNVLVHNLAKGIPFPDGSVDAVYHSHFLEHLDRPIAEQFLREVRRVLRPGGIHRIAVPDFEKACREYLQDLDRIGDDVENANGHEQYIATIIEQSVRRDGYSSRNKKGLRRLMENMVLGDARSRGETHQWMYDRVSLRQLLAGCGYQNATVRGHNDSDIPGWEQMGLEVKPDGSQYKSASLYVEAVKP